jgi:AraC-like DNA-binding protein
MLKLLFMSETTLKALESNGSEMMNRGQVDLNAMDAFIVHQEFRGTAQWNRLFLYRLNQELEQRLSEPTLNVTKLAELMALSRRTLHRKLKNLLQTTPNLLIRRCRLERGALLLGSGKSVMDTAILVGFDSPSYFTQCFKQQFGVTPRAYTIRRLCG